MTETSYSHPPITEAVIQLVFASKVSDDELAAARKYLKKNYNSESILEDLALNVNLDSNNIEKNSEKYSKFSSQDETEVCLLKSSFLAISQLAPYASWEVFIERFKRDYQLHRKHAGYKEIRRIGVRYINRIDIPITAPVLHENDYLNIYPKYPESLGVLSGYAIQQRSFIPQLKSHLTINSGVIQSPLLMHSSILFDQDIGREVELPQTVEDLISFLNQVRVEKNKVFEACITDATRGLFRK